MDSIKGREHGSLKLWVLLVVIGVALVAACGFAKPAWATSAYQEGEAATVSSISDFQSAVSAKATPITLGTGFSSDSDLGGVLTVEYDLVLNLNGQTLNIGDNGTLMVASTSANPTLTVNGAGTITSSSTTATIQIGYAVGESPIYTGNLILNGGTVTHTGDASGAYSLLVLVGEATIGADATVTTATSNDVVGAVCVGGNEASQSGKLTINGTVSNTNSIALSVLNGECTVGSTGKISGNTSHGLGVVNATAQGESKANITFTTLEGCSITDTATPAGASVINCVQSPVEGYTTTIDIQGGTITGGSIKYPTIYNGFGAQSESSGSITVTGGTIKNQAPGGAAISNNNNGNLMVGGNAQLEGDVVADPESFGTTSVGGSAQINGDVRNMGSGETAISGGSVNGYVFNTGAGTTNIGGTANIEHDVINSGSGEIIVTDGTIGGTLQNTGNGDAQWSGGTIAGGVEGDVNVVPPESTPGTPEAVTGNVAGVVGPVAKAMAPYGVVSVSSDTYTWNVKVTVPETPVATVAEVLVSPIVTAMGNAGATSAQSVQNNELTITLPSSADGITTFANGVLTAAVPMTPANPASAPATLGNLEGKTCGVTVTTNTGNLTYTFNFGEAAPVPPEPTTDCVAVYRLYNPYDFLHIYTSDANEVASLKANGWTVDFGGAACWYAPVADSEAASYQIIRLYNPYNGDHYFVKASDTEQIDGLLDLGWQKDSEASAFWSAAESSANVEVTTLYNPYAQVDTHLYTANQDEVDIRTAEGWELNTPIIWGVAH